MSLTVLVALRERSGPELIDVLFGAGDARQFVTREPIDHDDRTLVLITALTK